jgi:HK97 family phage major capsid protein
MSTRIEGLAGELDALRLEITELDALENPTEVQAARYAECITEWDSKKAAQDDAIARAAKLEEINAAPTTFKREAGFSVPNVIVRQDPFENVSDLRADDRSNDTVARAITAFETSGRGVSDAEREVIIDKIENIPGAAVHALVHGSPAYRSAFSSWMKTQGQNSFFTAEESDALRASMTLTGANGGFTLPTLLDPTLIKTGTATRNPIRSVARVVQGTQNVLNLVTVNGVATYWVAEGSAFTDGTPAFTNPQITASKLAAYLTGSFEIFEDSNLQAQLPGLIAEAFDYAEGTAFISGSGSGAPKGIVTAISATAASTVTATTRGSFTSASVADVFAVVNATAPRYEDNSTWVANKAWFNTVRQIANPSAAGQLLPPADTSLLGSPIINSSDMSSATTSGTVMAILGDFSSYVIYDRLGTTVNYVENVVDGSGLPLGQRGLVAYKRVGANVTDLNAFRFLKA